MKILLGISQSTEAQKVLDCILKLFAKQDISLTLFHAVTKEADYIDCKMMGYFSPQEEEVKEEDWTLLNTFESLFLNAGFSCEKILKNGNPIDEILEISKDFDLLIIGSSESTFLPKIFTSHQSGIIDSSPIPVLVAK